jgi:hypothetical protein
MKNWSYIEEFEKSKFEALKIQKLNQRWTEQKIE